MPDYIPKYTEPAGTEECSNCGEKRQLWSDEYSEGEYVKPICVPCLINERPSDYPRSLLEDVQEYSIIDMSIILDFGYGIEAEFEFSEERIPASRNPNETETVIRPSLDKTATIYYEGEKLDSCRLNSWRKKAQQEAEEFYIDKR